MQHEFWHERWDTNQIGFHLQEVNPVLLKHWSRMNAAAGQRVLVPLCGKTLDIIWLLQQGFQVTGVELSERALDELCDTIEQHLGIAMEKFQDGDRVRYQGTGIELIAGDFFALQRHHLPAIDVVYDRAALVALPEEMRAAYCKQLIELTAAAPQLLVSFSYDQSHMSGPPFAVLAEEVAQHYQDVYQLECVDQRDIIEHEDKFRQRGLTSFVQEVYCLIPRS